MDTEAREHLRTLNKRVATLGSAIHEMFVAEGCASYVKTISIGYHIGGDMVSALYGHGDHVEVALARASSAERAFLELLGAP